MLDKPWILQVISLYVQCRRGQVFHWGWRTCLFAGAVAMFTLSEPQSPRFHFSPPKKHENGAEIWKYQEGAVQRAGEPTAGHQLLPTAEKGSSCGGGSRPLLPHPQLHLARRLWNPIPLPKGSSSFIWPQTALGCPALCTGSFLAEPGFSPCPCPALFPTRPLPAGGTAASCLPMPQPAAGCGPSKGLLEISGRAETSFKQQALPYSVHQHRGDRDLVRGQGGNSSLQMGFSSVSVVPPRFCESKRPGNRCFKMLSLVACRDAKGCQKARFLLGDKAATAPACRLRNIKRGLCEGCARSPCSRC